ncbi:MAG: RNB domain-containing ribonuclease [Pseudarcicella sp.]|nr:RNB domain-containing ribonuclease [Pseudarcicella sp.]MBP6409846.1 RNB domain-containing ribonuclease [Pseudarcicella sp.]
MSIKANDSRQINFLKNLKEEIVAFFEVNSDKPLSLNQVHKGFAIRDRETKERFNKLIAELHDAGRLIRQTDGNYLIDSESLFATGKVDHVNARFAFVVLGDGKEDIKVHPKDLNGAVDGDIVKVLARASKKNKSNAKPEGEVVEIVTRRSNEIVGTIEVLPKYAFVVPDSKKLYQDIFVPLESIKKAKNGEKVIVKVTKWADDEKKMEGFVKEVLGKAGENNTEMHAILAEFGLPISFPESVELDAKCISEKITEEEIAQRRDFRNTTTFTIDPHDAKDFDDAISFELLENGNYQIGVHIADVSHYVKPGSILEEEAFKRATSIYLVDRVVPMLPEKLSNELCSLRPNEDKLTFSAVFDITPDAKIEKEWFGRTVIHSDKRFSYEEAQIVLDELANGQEVQEAPIEETPKKKTTKKKIATEEENSQKTNNYSKELNVLNNLAQNFRNKRFANGAVNFETIEVKFKLDENGKPLSVYQKERKETHKLIEEFMLLANKRVAEYVRNLRKEEPLNTMVYRIHEAPDTDRLKGLATFTKKFGYDITTEGAGISASLNNLLQKIEGKPEQNILENLAIRTMSKARYSTEAIGHFGLAFPFYSHFTSPIRRYPDVIAHRLLQHYLDGGSPQERASIEAKCKHSSDMERLANEAERASIKYKQVEYMSLMEENKQFEGIITGVTEFGIFVEITDTACEGLVRMADLKDDYYDLDKENFRIVGQSNGRVFTFGDKVKVSVKECNLARRSMDLELVDMPEFRKGRSNRRESKLDSFSKRSDKNTRFSSKSKPKKESRRKR